MNLQFILGRSGSGKTHYCVDSIKQSLINEGQGKPIVFLVPDQATFQMEQALLAGGDLSGFNRVHILSFERLSQKILMETGLPNLPRLSEIARQMILRRLLQTNHDQLQVFSNVSQSVGFIGKLSSMIQECRQYQKTPDELVEKAKAILAENNTVRLPLAKKLLDLSIIYQAYIAATENVFLDSEAGLDIAAAQCGSSIFLRDCTIFIDGFAGYTPQQYHLLAKLFQVSQDVFITLCLDPRSKNFIELDQTGDVLKISVMDYFHSTLAFYHRLKLLAKDQGCNFLPLISLPLGDTKVMPRFAKCNALAAIEANIFNQHTPSKGVTTKVDALPAEGVVVVEADTCRIEVEACAGHILKLCREHGYRYKDIAIILRELGDYQSVIETTFSDYGIACFIDKRRPVRHHPLIELIRSVLQIASSNYKTEFILNYLKTGLGPIDQSEVDLLENYIIANGVDFAKWYEPKPWVDLENVGINDIRKRVIEPIAKLARLFWHIKKEKERFPTVAEMTIALFKLLTAMNVPQTLHLWVTEAKGDGDLDKAIIHEQIYGEIVGLFEEIVDTLGSEPISLEAYGEILNHALSTLSLGMVPPALDQVIVGSIERSRQPALKAVFLLGVNEGKFPKVASNDSFFTDSQRQYLLKHQFELGPSQQKRLFDERYLGYIALTRASAFLWVSCPVTNSKGATLNPSMIIKAIKAALPDVPLVKLSQSILFDPHFVSIRQNVYRQLALVSREADSASEHFSLNNHLGSSMMQVSSQRARTERALSGLCYDNVGLLTKISINEISKETLVASISRLESYAACPYKHFSRYFLKLKERKELAFDVLELGDFFHNALYEVFKQIKSQSKEWDELSDNEIDQAIEIAIKLLTEDKGVYQAHQEISYRNRFVIVKARKQLQLFCRILRRYFESTEFKQIEAEFCFGPECDTSQLSYVLANGKTLVLQGKIDRIDQLADGTIGVVDYKTSGKKFDFSMVYHGLALQLLTYLKVASTLDPNRQPAYTLYMPVVYKGDNKNNLHNSASLDTERLENDLTVKSEGLYNGHRYNDIDASALFGAWSAYHNVYVNKEGSVLTARNKTVVTSPEIDQLMSICESHLKSLAVSILAGNIEIAPYQIKTETPCVHCPYKPVCRFDMTTDKYRSLGVVTKDVILQSDDNSTSMGGGA